MTVKTYLLSFPERLIRSALGLGAGVVREVGEVALPDGIRQSQLYQNLVDATLRYLIEQVGGVEGVYAADSSLPDNFLARRTAGNAVEVLGIVAFRASPVWVLAALADLCGLGRHLIPEISDALKAQGLLEKDAQFATVDQMLDGLERTSARLATTINTPPLDVAGLRKEWEAIREEARGLPSASLPSGDTISNMWAQLKAESARQDRSVFETSSVMAVSAARAVPGGPCRQRHVARAQRAAARGARRSHAVGDKPKGRGRALIKIEDRDSNLKKVRFGELYGLKSETSRVSGKGHIGNHLPHDIVDRIEADFDFRPTSWQPCAAVSRSCSRRGSANAVSPPWSVPHARWSCSSTTTGRSVSVRSRHDWTNRCSISTKR
jgi:hypothetical protein